MTEQWHGSNPDERVDEESPRERARPRATTSEEAMDDATTEDGHSDESAYAPTENPPPRAGRSRRRTA